VHRLAQTEDLVAVSSLYETDPIGGPDQGSYFNAVAVVETTANPRRLLARCMAIEHDRGRWRRIRWGPRSLDLDLLIHGMIEVSEKGLTVPHPRLVHRRFVLEPLLEVWPEAALPDGTPVSGYLDGVADQDVTIVSTGDWWA
jgi:2-amino-4-hydroxy-6-hydroxymethyldihydropteridine diphosphokinase